MYANVKNLSGKLEDFLVQTTPKQISYPTNNALNTTRETLMGQSSPSHSGEGKVEEIHVACDAAEKDKINGKIQVQQAAQRPCAASMMSKIMKQ